MEARVAALERELHEMRLLMQSLLQRLETHFGKDLDNDGRIG